MIVGNVGNPGSYFNSARLTRKFIIRISDIENEPSLPYKPSLYRQRLLPDITKHMLICELFGIKTKLFGIKQYKDLIR